MSRKPNIVIFNPDQWRWDVQGHMGNPAAVTPVLDGLARSEAVSFRNAFIQNGVCTPSRCSFMSGWYPHVRGHRTMHHMMKADEPVLLKTLKDSGYYVYWGGKNDLIPGDSDFSPYCDYHHDAWSKARPIRQQDKQKEWRGKPGEPGYYSMYVGKIDKGDADHYHDHDWENVTHAVDFIKKKPKQPFCIYLPLTYPHPPYGVEEPWFSMIDRAKLPPRIRAPRGWKDKPGMLKGIYKNQNLAKWGEENWTELRATYYGMCARVDHQLGLLVEALREAKLYDDTALFSFSDHGDFTGDYGLVEKNQNTFEDCLTRVPFLVKPPKGVAVKPRVSNALVELIDFPVTVEELCGITPSHTHFGRSLLPVISGATDTHRDAVFCEGGRLKGEEQCKELESDAATVKGSFYWPRIDWQVQDGPEHGKAVMCRTKRYKYVRRLYESDELYDLKNDPGETKNVIDSPKHRKVLSELQERMLTHFLETGDVVPFETDRR